MSKVVLDKVIIEETAKLAIGNAFAGFSAKPDAPCECAIGVFEDLEDSRCVGAWTECIRKIIREKTPMAECVCVKPIPMRNIVWYTVIVA